MSRIAYVNGRYLPHREASVHVEDRGYQFADGVYEVIPVHHGRLVEEEPHLDRLDYSLGELRIAWPVARAVLSLILRELVGRNGLDVGFLYWAGVACVALVFPEFMLMIAITAMATHRTPSAIIQKGVSFLVAVSVGLLRFLRTSERYCSSACFFRSSSSMR